jgi:hypothetical protein
VITGLDFLPHTQLLYGVGQVVAQVGNAGYQLFTLDLKTGKPSFIGVATNLLQITSIEFIEPFVEVAIDIKPDHINPKSKGKIQVAILSTSEFNSPEMVEIESLTFGRTGDEQSLAFCHGAKDVNRDRLQDLVCHFYSQDAGFQCGDTEGVLKGETVQGTPIEGIDSVKITPCR